MIERTSNIAEMHPVATRGTATKKNTCSVTKVGNRKTDTLDLKVRNKSVYCTFFWSWTEIFEYDNLKRQKIPRKKWCITRVLNTWLEWPLHWHEWENIGGTLQSKENRSQPLKVSHKWNENNNHIEPILHHPWRGVTFIIQKGWEPLTKCVATANSDQLNVATPIEASPQSKTVLQTIRCDKRFQSKGGLGGGTVLLLCHVTYKNKYFILASGNQGRAFSQAAGVIWQRYWIVRVKQ